MNKSIAVTSVVAGLLIAGVVFAQSANSNAQGQAIASNANAGQLNQCENVANNLQKRVQTFEANRNKSVETYEQIRVRLNNLADKLEEEGYDVTSLRTNLVTFEGMFTQLEQNHYAYMLSLGETKDYACGRTKGEFSAKMTTTRTRLRAVHGDLVGLRTFWEQTLKADLKALDITQTEVLEGSL